MNVNIVLNGTANNFAQQAKQLQAFIDTAQKTSGTPSCKDEIPCGAFNDLDFEKGTTYIIAKNGQSKTQLLKLAPTKRVEFIWTENYNSEDVLDVLCQRMNTEDVYLFGNDSAGLELSVRAAVRKKGASAVNINELQQTEKGIVIGKPLYSNYCQGSFLVRKNPCCFSIAKGLGESEVMEQEHLIAFESNIANVNPIFVSTELELENKTVGLEDAKFLIAVGRGAKSKEAVMELEEIAENIDAKLGVSRPAAMNAWAPMEKMVGVSGAMLSPNICIAVGASGAAAFYAGIQKSGFIVAINTDERASILKKADIAIIGDYRPILLALSELISQA